MRAWLHEFSRYVLLHAATRGLRHDRDDARAEPPEVVVSLTTIPSRIQAIYPTLRSLSDQTVRPARIVVALPAYSRRQQRPYVVPDRIRQQPLVTVLAAGRDWGPATKLIPALEQLADRPDTLVLAVDDDNVYPRTFIETMVRHASVLPDAAFGLRGWPVPASLRWRDRLTIFGTDVAAPVRTDVLEGCGGILVRPRFFDSSFRDLSEAAHFADDVWISGHLARNGIPAYVVPHRGTHIHLGALASLLGPALNHTENRDGVHEQTLIEHFRGHWSTLIPPANVPCPHPES